MAKWIAFWSLDSRFQFDLANDSIPRFNGV